MPPSNKTALEKAKAAAGELSFSELREMRSHIETLVEKKKKPEIDRIRKEMLELGIDPREIAGTAASASRRKASGGGKAKVWYRNPENSDLVWRGKGKRPGWLQEMVDRGEDISGLRFEPEEA